MPRRTAVPPAKSGTAPTPSRGTRGQQWPATTRGGTQGERDRAPHQTEDDDPVLPPAAEPGDEAQPHQGADAGRREDEGGVVRGHVEDVLHVARDKDRE